MLRLPRSRAFLRPCARHFTGLTLAAFVAATLSLAADNPQRSPTPVVRVVYLVPADREVRDDYVVPLRTAIRHVRIWFRDEMSDSTTFSLPKPVVQVVHTFQTASSYNTNPAGDDQSLWFWNNVLTDAFALTGARFFDPDNVWIFYIDSDPACGQRTGGTSGVALVGANDLRGLAGEPNVPPCPGDAPDTAGVCRWVGGLGHELGHALGLPHPSGCEDSDPATVCPTNALMWLGYISYPEAHLLNEDEEVLMESPFFFPMRGNRPLFDCSDLSRGH